MENFEVNKLSPNPVWCMLRGSELLILAIAHYDCQLGPPYDDYHQSRYQVCWSGRSAGHPSPWVFSQKAAPQLPRVAGNATSTPPNPILWGLGVGDQKNAKLRKNTVVKNWELQSTATSTPPNPGLCGLRDPKKSSPWLFLDFWTPSSKTITTHICTHRIFIR